MDVTCVLRRESLKLDCPGSDLVSSTSCGWGLRQVADLSVLVSCLYNDSAYHIRRL